VRLEWAGIRVLGKKPRKVCICKLTVLNLTTHVSADMVLHPGSGDGEVDAGGGGGGRCRRCGVVLDAGEGGGGGEVEQCRCGIFVGAGWCGGCGEVEQCMRDVYLAP
jgi:hypothetical protein